MQQIHIAGAVVNGAEEGLRGLRDEGVGGGGGPEGGEEEDWVVGG